MRLAQRLRPIISDVNDVVRDLAVTTRTAKELEALNLIRCARSSLRHAMEALENAPEVRQ